jgi:hypothetical protein
MRVKSRQCYCCQRAPDSNFYIYSRDTGIYYGICAIDNGSIFNYDNVIFYNRPTTNYLILNSSYDDLQRFDNFYKLI